MRPLLKIAMLAFMASWATTVQGQDETVYIDAMVLYSQRAMCAHANAVADCTYGENHIQIETEIWLNAMLTNTAFKQSGVDAELRLVQVKMDDHEYDDDDYEQILDSLISRETDGDLDLASCGVDIVAYLVDKDYTHDGANSAFDYDKGYFVVTRDAKHEYIFTHEVGHLLGLDHSTAFCRSDRKEQGEDFEEVPCFKTLMADQSACACTSDGTDGNYVHRVLYFSSADLNWSDIMLSDGSNDDSSVDIILNEGLKHIQENGRESVQSEECTWPPPNIADGKMEVNIVVSYDKNAMCGHASKDDDDCDSDLIKDEVFANIHLTNTAFVLSRVNIYLNLVWLGEQNELYEKVREMRFQETGAYTTSPGHYVRYYFCADFHAMITDWRYTHWGDNGSTRGVGLGRLKFSRNSKHQYVFTHELGHHLGLRHDEKPYSYDGYCNTNVADGGPCFKTVMAQREDTDCHCMNGADMVADTNYVPRTAIFNNPDLSYSGIELPAPVAGGRDSTRNIMEQTLSEFWFPLRERDCYATPDIPAVEHEDWWEEFFENQCVPGWFDDKNEIMIRTKSDNLCLDVVQGSENVVFSVCDESSSTQKWSVGGHTSFSDIQNFPIHFIEHRDLQKCLKVIPNWDDSGDPTGTASVTLMSCNPNASLDVSNPYKRWERLSSCKIRSEATETYFDEHRFCLDHNPNNNEAFASYCVDDESTQQFQIKGTSIGTSWMVFFFFPAAFAVGGFAAKKRCRAIRGQNLANNLLDEERAGG